MNRPVAWPFPVIPFELAGEHFSAVRRGRPPELRQNPRASTEGRDTSPAEKIVAPRAWMLREHEQTVTTFARLFSLPVRGWRIDYNMNRSHSAHGWPTPVEFGEAWFRR